MTEEKKFCKVRTEGVKAKVGACTQARDRKEALKKLRGEKGKVFEFDE